MGRLVAMDKERMVRNEFAMPVGHGMGVVDMLRYVNKKKEEKCRQQRFCGKARRK